MITFATLVVSSVMEQLNPLMRFENFPQTFFQISLKPLYTMLIHAFQLLSLMDVKMVALSQGLPWNILRNTLFIIGFTESYPLTTQSRTYIISSKSIYNFPFLLSCPFRFSNTILHKFYILLSVLHAPTFLILNYSVSLANVGNKNKLCGYSCVIFFAILLFVSNV